MSVERIIVETNDETGNNPVEYDWEFDPDGTFHMSGTGKFPPPSRSPPPSSTRSTMST